MYLLTFLWTVAVITSCALPTPTADGSDKAPANGDEQDKNGENDTNKEEIVLDEQYMIDHCDGTLRQFVMGPTGMLVLMASVLMFIITVVALVCFK